MASLLVFGAVLICFYRVSAETEPVILTNPKEVSNITAEVLTCNLTNPPSAVQGHYWTRNGKVIDETQKTSPALYIEYKLKKSDTQSGGEYACVFRSNPMFQTVIIVKVRPHVVTSKHSEHGNEKDKAMLICESHSFPQVSEWKWYFAGNDMARKLIVDSEKYKIGSSPNKTTLHIYDLDANQDSGNYTCQGKNEVGERSVTILLRVRSRLAALWPFLGIVVEVFVLVVVIFVYEKRRKPEDICDGAAPLKSKTAANDKDKNVRQRK